MTAGRKRKPTALSIIQGNPGKRRLNQREPAGEDITVIAPPDYLSDVAKKEYSNTVEMLARAGIVKNLDLKALELYAQTYATWREAMEKTELTGMVVKAQSGFPVQNPYFNIANQAAKRLQSLLAEFGMTPSSRSSVSASPPSSDNSDGLFDN